MWLSVIKGCIHGTQLSILAMDTGYRAPVILAREIENSMGNLFAYIMVFQVGVLVDR